MKILFLYIPTILIWGSTWYAIKFQLGEVDPMVSVAYRFTLASLILFIYCWATRKKLRFSLKEHLFIALQGFLSFTIGYWLVYVAEIYLTSGLVAVIVSSLIFMNILNRAWLLKTKIHLPVVLGAFIGIGGIVLIFRQEITSFHFSDRNFVALLFCILSTIIYSFGNIVVERNQKHSFPVIPTNAYSMAYGALIMFVLSLITGKPFTFNVSFGYLFSFVYLAVFGSVVAFYCYFTLIGKIGADKAAYIPVAVPVIALAISSLFEGYRWTLFSLFGILLILAGNLLVISRKTLPEYFSD